MDQRGFDSKGYQNFGPDEIAKLITNEDALRMILPHKENPEKKALILYSFTRVKHDVQKLLKLLTDPESDLQKELQVKPEHLDVLIMTMEEVKDNFHKGALEAWTSAKLKMQFWEMRRLVNYPLDHVLQPKFEVIPHDQHAELLKQHYIKSKAQLPMIRFHDDMAARCLGLVPGDIVKITSASPSAGQYIKYRVCVP
jgi:DNA-directed RNA polymerase subunit H (RpoH/RPB5)